MIEIQIAGAGAGKTYGLAKKIVAQIKNECTEKKIFALTFTNAAKSKIEFEVKKRNGFIPNNLFIETVHSFLLNEVIFPYSQYTLGEKYNKCSIMYLGQKPQYKAKKIKSLKEQNIIHSERVYDIAKQIIDEDNNKHKSKKKKTKVKFVISLLQTCVDSILIDEVQDLDHHALRCFEVLGLSNIAVYMIGDPKQAINWPKDFEKFINKCETDKTCSVTVLEPINTTRRVPSEILIQSNRFCLKGQEQKSLSNEKGSVKYIESIHEDFEQILKEHISKGSIVCIDKKTGNYNTGNSKQHCFPYSIENKLKKSEHIGNKDETLFIGAVCNEFCYKTSKSSVKASVNALVTFHNLDLEKSEFAQLYEFGNLITQTHSKYMVRSINAVKGLESNTCIFVLSPNTLKYFLQEEIEEGKRFNKEWKKIYVALTRAKKELVLALDHDLLCDLNIKSVKKSLENLGIHRF